MGNSTFKSSIILIALSLVTLFGCANNKRPLARPTQGKATWQPAKPTTQTSPTKTTPAKKTPTRFQPKDQPSLPPKSDDAKPNAETDNSDIDKNKVAKDLEILVPPPGYHYKDNKDDNSDKDDSKDSETSPETLIDPIPEPSPTFSPEPSPPAPRPENTPSQPPVAPSPIAPPHVVAPPVVAPPVVAPPTVAPPPIEPPSVEPTNPTSPAPLAPIVPAAPDLRAREKLLKAKIDQAYASRADYNPALIKNWILSLINIDAKVTKEVVYGNKYKRTIRFENESQTFIRVFESLAVISGKALVPMYDTDGNLIEEKQLAIGGALMPSLDGKIFAEANGVECTKVLCALTSIFGSSEAAFDVLFIYFRYQYLITLQAPENELNDYIVIPPSVVREIAQTLWIMPSTFYGLKSLLTIRLVRPCLLTESDPTRAADAACTNFAGYFSTVTNSITREGEATQYEALAGNIKLFTKDLDATKSILVHEMTHAYDAQVRTTDEEISKLGIPVSGPGLNFAGHLSLSQDWLSLSEWKYLGDQSSKRVILPFTLVPGQRALFTYEVPKIWAEPNTNYFWRSYGTYNPQEDLAVSVEGYMTLPQVVKTHTPAKYDYVQKKLFTFKFKGTPFTWEY